MGHLVRWAERGAGKTNHVECGMRPDRGNLDTTPIPRRGVPPINGQHYTWADDVLNLEMRENEEPYNAMVHRPSSDSPVRCKGFSRKSQRPCRNLVLRNADGKWLDFCGNHMGNNVHNAKDSLARVTPFTRHGAYSQVIREQIIEAVAFRDNSEAAAEMRRDLQIIDSIDAEDTTSGLKELIVLIQTAIARMNRKYYRGELSEMDYLRGLAIFSEQQRKLLATRAELLGSASDEMKGAIEEALDKLGLGGESDSDSPDEMLALESGDEIDGTRE